MKVLKKPAKPSPKKRLRAAAQRTKHAEDDYSSEEPNVRLSRAFVVVLLLHVVAVGGIFAFSALKDHQTVAPSGKPEKQESANLRGSAVQPVALKEAGGIERSGTKVEAQKLVGASHQITGSGVKSQSSGTQESLGEAGKTYVVQKGDSPAGIAKKFKVNYADLLRTNNIEDPKKLQIGQKLYIP